MIQHDSGADWTTARRVWPTLSSADRSRQYGRLVNACRPTLSGYLVSNAFGGRGKEELCAYAATAAVESFTQTRHGSHSDGGVLKVLL
jgi:hypothetical protein